MEVEMKRFRTALALFGVSFLAVWAIFQLLTASQHQPENRIAPIALQTAQAENMNASDSNKALVPTSGVESRLVAPVFDSNGALVSDPSGALSKSSGNSGIPVTGEVMVESRLVAPVFDSNGALVSDPSGALSKSSGNSGIPVTGKVMNVAPVIDSAGKVVSNPSGLQLNTPNPKGQWNIAPVFDSNGKVVSDPSGTILNSSHP
jgi:hypothetical protein